MDAVEPSAAARERLSVERIVEEALDLAAKQGVRGISMRPLAARFGVSATALYGHVASRDALLGLMLDSVLADVPPLAPDLPWDVALRTRALQLRDALGPYPQLALEALGGHTETTRVASGRDAMVSRLERAGFEADDAELAILCWGRWVLSFLAAAEHTPPDSGNRAEVAFERGVDFLLAGLRTLEGHGAG